MPMMRSYPAFVIVLALACDPAPKAEAPKKDASPVPKSAAAESKVGSKVESKAEPARLPPAPEGAVTIDGVYVQSCVEPHGCPPMLQDAGAKHCKELTLGELSWQLPTLEQLESWKDEAALSGFDVFHWSGSAWDEDPAQFWIYDPGSGSKTTAKPDRKPFTIRCVARPS